MILNKPRDLYYRILCTLLRYQSGWALFFSQVPEWVCGCGMGGECYGKINVLVILHFYVFSHLIIMFFMYHVLFFNVDSQSIKGEDIYT